MTKKAKELPKEEKQSTPLGLTARMDSAPIISFQQFFDLMRIVDSLSNLVNFAKQENFNADNIRYYFQKDLEEAKDKDGNTILVKNQKGEDVPQMKLVDDFWTKTKENNG